MARLLVLSIVLGLVAALAFTPGCASDDSAAVAPGAMATVTLCGGCGQIKGTDSCCAAGASTCVGCGLAKGSPGCCNMAKGQSATLCNGCGQIKGSDACCDDSATRCGCGMIKGSPGCCKMPK